MAHPIRDAAYGVERGGLVASLEIDIIAGMMRDEWHQQAPTMKKVLPKSALLLLLLPVSGCSDYEAPGEVYYQNESCRLFSTVDVRHRFVNSSSTFNVDVVCGDANEPATRLFWSHYPHLYDLHVLPAEGSTAPELEIGYCTMGDMPEADDVRASFAEFFSHTDAAAFLSDIRVNLEESDCAEERLCSATGLDCADPDGP